MLNRSFTTRRSEPRGFRSLDVVASAITLLLVLVAPAMPQDDMPKTFKGKAILEHPAGKALVEAAKLLKAGKAGEVRRAAVKEVRDEWNAMSAAEQKEEAERLKGRTPDPAWFAAEVAKAGELTVYADAATLQVVNAAGEPVAMGFAGLEGGKWLVSRGPMTIEAPEPETAPAVSGAAILEHELGKLALDYAGKLASGKLDAALALLTGPARERRAALPPAELEASDEFRKSQLPAPAELSRQIAEGGDLRFYGDKAVLNVVTNVTIRNADGSMTSTSTSTGLGFEKVAGRWAISD